MSVPGALVSEYHCQWWAAGQRLVVVVVVGNTATNNTGVTPTRTRGGRAVEVWNDVVVKCWYEWYVGGDRRERSAGAMAWHAVRRLLPRLERPQTHTTASNRAATAPYQGHHQTAHSIHLNSHLPHDQSPRILLLHHPLPLLLPCEDQTSHVETGGTCSPQTVVSVMSILKAAKEAGRTWWLLLLTITTSNITNFFICWPISVLLRESSIIIKYHRYQLLSGKYSILILLYSLYSHGTEWANSLRMTRIIPKK